MLLVQGGPLLANSILQEEKDPVVWNVSFEGNDSYSGIVLSQVIATEEPNLLRKIFRRLDDYALNETELRRDRIRIIRYYERRGYDQVQVDVEHTADSREWQRNIVFRIREGEPIRISSSSVVVDADSATAESLRGERSFQRRIENHDFQEGNRFETIRRPDVVGSFTQIMENHGFPWASVDIEADIDSLAKSADVRIVMRPGAKSYFSDFMFEGVESVPERIVAREMPVDIGDMYDSRQIQESQRQIFGHHLFRFATITIPDQEQDSTLAIRVRVREHPLRTVEATVGFGSEEYLRGQVNWQNRNISGNGHRLGFNARGSFIEQRLGANYLIPYVFNTRSSFVSSPYGQRRLEPAYELMRAGISNSLIYQIKRAQTATVSYEFSFNEESSRGGEVSLPDTILGYNVSSLLFSGYYSQRVTRDPEGWVVQPSAEFSGTFGESTFTFQKLTLDVRHYLPLSRSTKLATRIHTGTIFYSQPDSLPANIRFFTGGTNSVRGWSRQQLGPKRPSFDDGGFDGYVPTGGRAMFTFNVELRQQLNFLFDGFGMGLFLDGGQVWREIKRVDNRPLQFGAGGGLRYQSPIGPVRIDVGYKVNPTEDDLGIFGDMGSSNAWDRIGIHFSIGQAF
ncbi:autotransporter assembly complex protein TamA [Rhodohalobacter sp. 8-1]|uniref:autotransporter assembly complex protein TamA n=1 Tax=Rhodohalobacter sp. 8-1 TaxID=3131972 RepID=UPI0030ECBEF6